MRNLIILALLLSASAHSQSIGTLSQQRAQDEDWQDASQRVHEALGPQSRRDRSRSAEGYAEDFASLRFSSLPVWKLDPRGAEFQNRFETARDERFLHLPEMPDFMRRISWLYPDDGCFMRAEKLGERLERKGYPRPQKLFIFGNLSLESDHAFSGSVYWWYHVAEVVRVTVSPDRPPQDSEIFILDPAIEPKLPIPVRSWIERMTDGPSSASFALCRPTTYNPASTCTHENPDSAERASADSPRFLRAEWNREIDLGLDPEIELGEHPPWKSMPNSVN